MKNHFGKLIFCLVFTVCASNLVAEGSSREFNLQWAVLQGVRDFTHDARGGNLAVSGLLEWDFRSGTINDYFPHDVVGSLQQGSKYFVGEKGVLSLHAGELLEPLDIDVSVVVESLKRRQRALQATKTTFSIRRAGKALSSPTVRTELGQRAMASAPGVNGQPPVYILVQVDPV